MGATSTYSLPYPDGLSSESNVPRDIRALAEAIETALDGLGSTFVGRLLQKNETQTIPTGTSSPTVIIGWDARTGDPGDAVGIVYTESGKLTIGETGFYRISADIRWNSSASGAREVVVIINGTDTVRNGNSFGVAGSQSTAVDEIFKLFAGDEVQIGVMQSSGGDLDVYGNASNVSATRLSIEFRGAAS